MVVFTCGHCGESVQKPKVEKHYLTKCRSRNPNLSCMDCFKDFLGKDYEAHTKCITEEQRYSSKDYVAKEKKGEKKQNAWVEMLQSVLNEQPDAPKGVLKIIETITKHNNTPRKKPKFINFVKNVCGQKTNPKDIDMAWDMISVKLSTLSNANAQNQKNKEAKENGVVNDKEDKENSNVDNKEEEQNGDIDKEIKEQQIDDENSSLQNGDAKKLSKKQRKEEKKRKKYEAELQSVVEPLPDDVDTTSNKKDKKKKNKTDSTVNGDIVDTAQDESNSKNKKRKRLDTVNGNQDVNDNGGENVVNEKKEKNQKKKPKINGAEETEDKNCLHNQTVAKTEETEDVEAKKDKFNWHAVILSVLEKKGNEVQFKRLQKKVLTEYSESTGKEVDDRIADKFIKKLKSAPNVKVDKNRVLLVQ